MSTAQIASLASLTIDPARWSEPLVDVGYGWHQHVSSHKFSIAEREVMATMSAIVGDSRPIVLQHNTKGVWAVRVDETMANQITVMWSAFTPDEKYGEPNHPYELRPILRGEAVMVMIHEMGHVLFTTEFSPPSWCDPAHWREFFSIVNATEDVRIEDALEVEVPAFPMLRRVENDRIMQPNLDHWDNADAIRHIMLTLFARRSCTDKGAAFDGRLSHEEAGYVAACEAAFDHACDAGSSSELVDRLRPVYDALVPLLNGSTTTQSGDPGGDEGEDEDGDSDTTQTTDADADEGDEGDGDAGGDADLEDADDAGDPTDTEGGDGGDGGSGGEGGGTQDTSTNDDAEGTDGDGANDAPAPDGMPDSVRPDRQRGQWDEDRPSSTPTAERSSQLLAGEWITTNRRTSMHTQDPTASRRLAPVTRMIVKSLRRVLQDNANGGWVGRRRKGAFDAQGSRRLALGDLRTFRKRVGPKGSLDYSLVVCMDASGSVAGGCGFNVADASLAIYDAASSIDGLDVALCAYGCTVDFAVPFQSTLNAKQKRALPAVLTRMLRCVRGGASGGTNETDALVWARAASRKRNADAAMIVVLTDGCPNDYDEVQQQVAMASREGIVTGGIGVGYDAPEYHTYKTSVYDTSQLPKVLGDLVRSMMKAR